MLIRARLAGFVLAALCLVPGIGAAQTFGQYTTAEIIPVGGHLVGGYLRSNDTVLGGLGQLRLSLYPNIDFGFQGGLSRVDAGGSDRTSVDLGGDVKFGVLQQSRQAPFDLAIGAAIGVQTSDEFSVLTFGPTAVISHGYLLGGAVKTRPYAGLGISYSQSSISDEDENDLLFPLRLGSEIDLGNSARFVFEAQLFFERDSGDDYEIAAGLNFPF